MCREPAALASRRPPISTTLSIGGYVGARMPRLSIARLPSWPLRRLLLMITAPLWAGCQRSGPYRLTFMEPPAALEGTRVSAYTDTGRVSTAADPTLLYATVRQPATAEDRDRFYSPRRGSSVRLGMARITLGRSDISWEEAREISILKNNTDRYPLQVGAVTEFGVLDVARHAILADDGEAAVDRSARDRFTAAVNARLARSAVKDIFIYVHGYKVNFENPLLVGAELWHFLGYEGVFIPFSWPSRTARLGYFGDVETARYSALFFRNFLEYLARETAVERIHILGYSAGTRLVAAALDQFALISQQRTPEEIRATYKLGNVVLAASDIDRGLLGTYLVDGLLRVPRQLTLYTSTKDKALSFSRFSMGFARAGQLDLDAFTAEATAYLRSSDALTLIGVESAPGFDLGNGHGYFRNNPWVSSDLLTTLRYGLSPAERGLVLEPHGPVWTFPPDYLTRLRAALARVNPALARQP